MPAHSITRTAVLFLNIIIAVNSVVATGWTHEVPWHRHTIDQSSQGADGVRFGDVDGDGRLDLATGWEEGG
ncbi:MAG: hypothetical protein KDA89_23205, partial [Planctomycetaceae bacterium]|nr:hypothetical protein [Planctomycetaceae bacterium]